jgi:hypothetical protein
MVQIKISDIAGRTYYTSSMQLQQGQQLQQVNLANLATGKYEVQILSPDFIINKVITKL